MNGEALSAKIAHPYARIAHMRPYLQTVTTSVHHTGIAVTVFLILRMPWVIPSVLVQPTVIGLCPPMVMGGTACLARSTATIATRHSKTLTEQSGIVSLNVRERHRAQAQGVLKAQEVSPSVVVVTNVVSG